MGQAWTEKEVEQLLVSPFSTVTVALALTKEHEPPMSTDAWIKANSGLIGSLGAESWLTQVLSTLEGKEGVDTRITPYNVINVDPRFAIEHAPIVPRETWIGTNAKLMPQRGVEQWLSMFLDILEGDTPGSSEFGPDVPYGYAPAGYQPPRKHSFPQGGKRRNKKKRKK
jgi:hypothetical protein